MGCILITGIMFEIHTRSFPDTLANQTMVGPFRFQILTSNSLIYNLGSEFRIQFGFAQTYRLHLDTIKTRPLYSYNKKSIKVQKSKKN